MAFALFARSGTDPEYQRALLKARPIAIPARVRSISWSSGYGYGSVMATRTRIDDGRFVFIPVSSTPAEIQTHPLKQAKMIVSPGSKTSSPGNGSATNGGPASSPAFTVKSSPIRRPRGEAKKCRKVYGMEHREQWCTQCKWKKACTRFGD